MIVKCEQCQTRFKIPDEKVTEKGVKVRCTKCQHTFRVKREAAAEASAVAPPPDPFAKFDPAPPPAEPFGEQTRPAMYALGVEQSRPPGLGPPLSPSYEAQSSVPREQFDAPTRVGPIPVPPPNRRPLTEEPAPFDFSSLGPPAPVGKPAQPFDFGALAPPAAAPVASPPRPAPAPLRSMFEPQPFDFSALAPPAAAPGLSAEAPVKARAPGPPKPSAFEPQPFDFSGFGGPAAPPAPAAAKVAQAPPQPSGFEPQPFDFSALDALAPPPPLPVPKASAPRAPAPSAPKPQKVAVPQPPPEPAEWVDDDAIDVDFGPPPPEYGLAMEPPRPSPGGAVTQVHAHTLPDDGPGLLGDVPPMGSDLSMDADGGLEASPEQRGALFDMPAAPEMGAEPVTAPQEQVAVAKIALKKLSAAEIANPDAEVPIAQSSSRRPRSVVAMVWNLVSAALVLVLLGGVAAVVLNDGKVDASLSWNRLKTLFSTPRELVAFDISNGLYDTRAGRPVFYVRGEVKNRGSRAGRVKVKAEILDGEDLVRAAECWVGATPSPEDLYSVVTAEDLASLAVRLAPAAVQLKPGGQAAFLVPFYEYPPDLKDFRVRVTVSPDDGSTAAR